MAALFLHFSVCVDDAFPLLKAQCRALYRCNPALFFIGLLIPLEMAALFLHFLLFVDDASPVGKAR
jgi:hypothetical protein